MHCYKLNNSYITYVNHYYINQCCKASKKERKIQEEVDASYCNEAILMDNGLLEVQTNSKIIPLPKNSVVKHKAFGTGFIVETNDKGYMIVSFSGRNKKFLYPQAFDAGYLTYVTI